MIKKLKNMNKYSFFFQKKFGSKAGWAHSYLFLAEIEKKN